MYRVSVNIADGTLEDGSPAHPDDLARFEPWRQKLENTGIRVKKCKPHTSTSGCRSHRILVHWIVNYELENRFEAAREILEVVTGEPPQEQHLFHGTRQANIDSYVLSHYFSSAPQHPRLQNTQHWLSHRRYRQPQGHQWYRVWHWRLPSCVSGHVHSVRSGCRPYLCLSRYACGLCPHWHLER